MIRCYSISVLAGCCVVAALATAGCNHVSAQASDPAREQVSLTGSELYGACAACHGASGEGNAAVRAPRIGGLPSWYIASELQRFQHNLRGKHPDDADGLRMRAMARQLFSDAEVAAVAEYVSQLVPVSTAASLTAGDMASGEALYAECASCHGARGEGDEQLRTPPLAGRDDWYIDKQIRKFRAGVRGTAAGDELGRQMQAVAATIDADSIQHVSAYLHTLSR